MPGRQVRIEDTLVAAVRQQRVALGFAPDAPDGAVLSELVRDGMRTRLDAIRRQERIELYADWAEERELREDAGGAMRAAISDEIA